MRLEPRAVAAVLSVLLHVLILSALLHVAMAAVKPPQPPDDTTASKLRGAGERVMSLELRPGMSASDLDCSDRSYIGVGVTSDPHTERILVVGENTPASRAGLQHDDFVLNPDVWRDSRRDGVVLHMLILREGVKMAVLVRVGKICIE
jgi:hypothetical protein